MEASLNMYVVIGVLEHAIRGVNCIDKETPKLPLLIESLHQLNERTDFMKEKAE